MNSENRRLIDLTFLLTITTGYMYILGCTYWYSFLNYFGIDFSFLSLSVNQIISSIWLLILLFIFAYFYQIEIRTSTDSIFPDIKISIGIFLPISMFFTQFLFSIFNISFLYVLLTFLLIFLVFIRLIPKFETRHYTIKQNKYASFILIFLFFTYIYYLFYGYISAKNLEKTDRFLTIELKSNNQQPLTNLILIIHMDSKYFLLDPPFSKEHKVIIINDEDVEKVTINKKK